MEGFYFVSPIDHNGWGEVVAYQNVDTYEIITKEQYNKLKERDEFKEYDFIPLYEI